VQNFEEIRGDLSRALNYMARRGLTYDVGINGAQTIAATSSWHREYTRNLSQSELAGFEAGKPIVSFQSAAAGKGVIGFQRQDQADDFLASLSGDEIEDATPVLAIANGDWQIAGP